MRIQDKDKLAFFQSLYKNWQNATNDQRELFTKCKKQYEGDPKIDGVNSLGQNADDATSTWNITYELIESGVSSEIPTVKANPRVWNSKNERNAKSAERLFELVKDRLPIERMNDEDERNTAIYGASVWVCEWDNSIVHGDQVGEVVMHVVPPERIVWDPSKTEVNDSEAIFVKFISNKSEINRKFGIPFDVLDSYQLDGAQEDDFEERNDTDGEVVAYVLCYWRGDDGTVNKFVWSGLLVLEDLEDYYARKRKYCKACGLREGACICKNPKFETVNDEYEEPKEPILLSHTRNYEDPETGVKSTMPETIPNEIPAERNADGTPVIVEEKKPVYDEEGNAVLDAAGVPVVKTVYSPKMVQNKIPFYKPKSFPIVVRKNIDINRSIIGKSDVETIRPQQQQINKMLSRAHQKLLRSGVTPCIPDDAEITLNNTVFGQVIKLKPGENRGQYGVLDTTPRIDQELAEATRIYESAKRILGITNAYQGQEDSTAKSGVAKQLQINQAAGRLQSKRILKGATHADLARVVFEQYLAFSDEPIPATYTDENGIRQNIQFNRYDFLVEDPKTGKYRYDDEYYFSADSTVNVEQQRETIWQINLSNLKDGSLGDPADPHTLLRYWLMQERAHYPYAEDHVEYFKTMANNMQNAQLAATQTAEQNNGGQNNGI